MNIKQTKEYKEALHIVNKSKMNNDIKEDYVSFEVSKLLKEKGFAVPCNFYFYIDGKVHEQLNQKHKGRLVDRNIYENQYSIPTHALIIKWIKENFGIHIGNSPTFQFNDAREDYLTVSDWQYWITVIKNGKYVQELSYSARENKNNSKESIEEALLYTLQNLIP